MQIPLVDLKAQYASIKPEIDAAVQRVIDNTSFILGKEVDDFEHSFARYVGAKGAVGVASGTGVSLGRGVSVGEAVGVSLGAGISVWVGWGCSNGWSVEKQAVSNKLRSKTANMIRTSPDVLDLILKPRSPTLILAWDKMAKDQGGGLSSVFFQVLIDVPTDLW